MLNKKFLLAGFLGLALATPVMAQSASPPPDSTTAPTGGPTTGARPDEPPSSMVQNDTTNNTTMHTAKRSKKYHHKKKHKNMQSSRNQGVQQELENQNRGAVREGSAQGTMDNNDGYNSNNRMNMNSNPAPESTQSIPRDRMEDRDTGTGGASQ